MKFLTDAPNVGEKERVVSGLIGAGLLAAGVRGRWGLGLLGAGLMLRAASGRCGLYHMLGLSSCDGHHQVHCGHAALTGEVTVQESLVIEAMPMRVYEFWRDLKNMPLFSENILSVTETGQEMSHWVARAHGLDGHNITWNAEMTLDEHNRQIEWKTLDQSDFAHRGSVVFVPVDNGSTEVLVTLRYQVLGGKLGQKLARLFGEEPGQQIRADLSRLKELLERQAVVS